VIGPRDNGFPGPAVALDGLRCCCDAWLSVFVAACNCLAVNTVNNDPNNCDLNTGQCHCKHPHIRLGLRCEKCILEHYMHPVDGCVACDGCPTDSLIGNGSCYWSELSYHVVATCGRSRFEEVKKKKR